MIQDAVAIAGAASAQGILMVFRITNVRLMDITSVILRLLKVGAGAGRKTINSILQSR